MDFNRAMKNAVIIGDEQAMGAEFFIHYTTFRDGDYYCCLKAPRYSKEKEKTINDVKKAWECISRGNFDKENGITSIEIVMDSAEVKESKKKTA